MRKFDYAFLAEGMVPARWANVVSAIAALKEREDMRRCDNSEIFMGLESVARVQSVKGSNAIEGIVTSDQRLGEIVRQSSAPLNHDEAEIAGYRDALALVHGYADTLDVRERDILRLHEVMLSYTPARGGAYKQADNVIMEVDASGRRSVRFAPTPATETAEAMEQLILAYVDARSDLRINALLLIPCFILDFLCIHPFKDGNGRMSRLLSLLLLYKSGFDAGKYISFEEQINKNKQAYYESLRQSSQGWHDNANSCAPFIENFITTLLMCYKELDKRFALVSAGRATKRARIEAVVLGSLLPISKQEIAYVLPDVSASTIEAALGGMVRAGLIAKVGVGRNTKYSVK